MEILGSWRGIALVLAAFTLSCRRIACDDGRERCSANPREGDVRVAFVHHALHMGGVERQIELTWSAVERQGGLVAGECGSRVTAEVLLFQERGAWAERIEGMGIKVSLYPIFDSKSGQLLVDSKQQIEAMVSELRRFDLAHLWYGGGPIGGLSTFASYVAARARVPVVQNLAWNVFTIDLSVAIVVVECDETQDLHRPNLEHRYNVSAAQLELLGVGDKEARQRILSQGFVMLPTQEQQHHRRLLALQDEQDEQEESLQRGGRQGVAWAGDASLSGAVLEELSAALHHSARKMPIVVRITPGINTTRFDAALPLLAALRRQAWEAREIVVGRISRLVPEKDPETFVRAAALLAHHQHLVFRIWGEGPERERLTALGVELGLAARLQWMGATESPEEALSQMHIFAYPTKGESVGWVLLEAMAMALPVISSHVGAVPSFVRHGDTGLLLQSGDGPEELSGLIELLVENPDLRLTLGTAARKMVETECSLDRFGQDYHSLYRVLKLAHLRS